MKQADLGLNLLAKRTRKREFPEQMDRVVPWAAPIGLIEPVYGNRSGVGRPPIALGSLLRIRFLQQADEEHRSTHDAVCTEQPVDGAAPIAKNDKMSASGDGDEAREKPPMRPETHLRTRREDKHLAMRNIAPTLRRIAASQPRCSGLP